MSGTIPLAAKTDGYYGVSRAEAIAQLPQPVGRVLDVGCGEGASAGPLRAAGAGAIVGIEIQPEPAAAAERVYDRVYLGDALDCLSQIDDRFDTILCYDVLEHLYDPLTLVAELRNRVLSGGRLHVSVPNASHVSLLRDLIVRGTFGYQPHGHRDATHLRWFTRRDIAALVAEAGWKVRWVTPSMLGPRSRTLGAVTGDRSTEFLAAQWHVLAER